MQLGPCWVIPHDSSLQVIAQPDCRRERFPISEKHRQCGLEGIKSEFASGRMRELLANLNVLAWSSTKNHLAIRTLIICPHRVSYHSSPRQEIQVFLCNV